MFSQYPYSAADSVETLSGASSTSYTDGVTPGYNSTSGKMEAPVQALGLQVTVSGFGGGEVDLVLQTAPSEADADGEWLNTDNRINGIVADGSYSINITAPIMDKVRLALVPVTAFTGVITPRWLCTAPIGSP